MVITLIQNPELISEQTFEETAFSKFVIQSLRGIVAEDTYDLFKIKSSAQYDKKNSELSLRIESLIEKKTKSKDQLIIQQNELDEIQTKNSKFIESLRELL